MDAVLTEAQVAERYHVKPETARDWRKHRSGPPWFKVGAQVFYREAAVVEWEKNREQKSA